jgi:hypothetical protein
LEKEELLSAGRKHGKAIFDMQKWGGIENGC